MAKQKQLSQVYVGWPKPDFQYTVLTNKNFTRHFNNAMLYAQYEMTTAELKREVVKYLKTHHYSTILDRIKDMNENVFVTFGKYMYLLNHGSDVPKNIMDNLIPALEKVVTEEETRLNNLAKQKSFEPPADSAPAKLVISIQDRIRDKAREIAGEIEGWIDDFVTDKKIAAKTIEEFVELFKVNDLKPPHLRCINTIFENRVNEIAEAASGDNKELTEAYSNFTKSELKKFDLFHKNLVKACVMIQEVGKVERAPKVKKPLSLDKVVSKLKYKKEDTTLGIVSMNPTSIVGAKEIWLYNTRTRKLSQYKAEDAAGLGVKGASLLNYSTESAEKTLRKPAEALAEFKKASKVKLRTFLKDLSTIDTPCTGKLNEHHIILRIDK